MILAANFKMNHTRESTRSYLETLQGFLQKGANKHDIFVFPPFCALDDFRDLNRVHIGAQNAYPAQKGAFSGEIGSEQLEEFSIRTILIGHSERRTILGESQEFCAQKFQYYAALGWTIFYCIGESLEVRQKGLEATLQYNLAELTGIDLSYPKLIIAYEPIWAIGTGVSAGIEQIDKTHTMLKRHFSCPLLYGGSVNAANIAEILALPTVDGALIGSAALSVDNFCEMIKKLEN